MLKPRFCPPWNTSSRVMLLTEIEEQVVIGYRVRVPYLLIQQVARKSYFVHPLTQHLQAVRGKLVQDLSGDIDVLSVRAYLLGEVGGASVRHGDRSGAGLSAWCRYSVTPLLRWSGRRSRGWRHRCTAPGLSPSDAPGQPRWLCRQSGFQCARLALPQEQGVVHLVRLPRYSRRRPSAHPQPGAADRWSGNPSTVPPDRKVSEST